MSSFSRKICSRYTLVAETLSREKVFYEPTTKTFKSLFFVLSLCVLLTETGLKKCILLTKTRVEWITSGFPSFSWFSSSYTRAVICLKRSKTCMHSDLMFSLFIHPWVYVLPTLQRAAMILICCSLHAALLISPFTLLHASAHRLFLF